MFSLQVRQTRLAAFVGVFGGSAMLWITVTSDCFAFVFQQPMGIGLEIRLARGPDFQRMTKGATGDEVGTVVKQYYGLSSSSRTELNDQTS